MIKVVIDTNIVISGFIKEGSIPEYFLVSFFNNGFDFIWCVSQDIFQEYQNVLQRSKFKNINQSKVQQFLSDIKEKALWVEPQIKLEIIKEDLSDNKFLECAAQAQAQYIISGDKHLLKLKKYKSIKIITPKKFKDILISKYFFI